MRFLVFVIILFISHNMRAQMHLRGDTLLGNEWIEHNKNYYRISVAEDGLYRIAGTTLATHNVTLPSGEQWQLLHMGEEVPIYVSDEGFGEDDFIVFYGRKNRNGLDSLLFLDKSKQLNPRYSLITDTNSYYLTSTTDQVQRLTEGQIARTNENVQNSYYWKTVTIDSHALDYNAYDRSQSFKLYNSEFSRVAGYGSRRDARYQLQFQPSDYFHVQDTSIGIHFRYSSFFVETGQSLVVETRVNSDILDTLTLGSFNLINKKYYTPTRSTGSFNIILRRLNHEDGRQFILSNLDLTYPARYDLSANKISFSPVPDQPIISILNSRAKEDYFIFDQQNRTFNIIQSTADTLTLSNLNTNGRFFIEPISQLRSIEHLKKLSFHPLFTNSLNSFIFLTSKKLYHQQNSPNPIDDYLTYRRSEEGGAFQAQLVFVEDLYDVYSYGIRRHPLAVNNFSQHLKLTDPSANLMIIGKGRPYNMIRTSDELDNLENSTFYVPSFGFPASDALLLAPVGSLKPRMSSGRLAVSNLDDVAIYLNNVKNYEQLTPTLPSDQINWKKKMIHLSGGNNLANAIRSEFSKMAATISATPYAPDILTYYKNGTTPVDSNSANEIYDRINKGVSIVTFFGHAAPNTLGFRIDNAQKYANAPIHPLFIALGCSAGNYNIPDQSVAEAYCLIENGGFLNLISSTSISKLFDLGFAGNEMYKLIGNQGASLTIGNMYGLTIEETARKSRRQAGQLHLFGDPSIRLNFHKEHDITLDKTSISVSPSQLSIESDSFQFSFDILNLGIAPNEPIEYKIIQNLPTGNSQVLDEKEILLTGYRTRVDITIPINGEKDAGINRIQIQLDPRNNLIESLFHFSESNNSYIHDDGILGFPIFIPNSSVSPIWPRNKSILPKPPSTFFVSTGSTRSIESPYYLEIDTTALFTSPALYKTNVVSQEGLITVQPEYNFNTAEVYYWRVRPELVDFIDTLKWSSPQSFIVIPGREGWNISHYYQYLSADKTGLDINENRDWTFEKNYIPIRFTNGVWNGSDQNQIGWFEYNSPAPESFRLPWEHIDEGLVVMAFKHEANQLWNPRGGAFGSIPLNKDKPYFAFENTATGRDSLIQFLEHHIPDEFEILFFTVRGGEENVIESNAWVGDSIRNNGINLFNYFERFGAEHIRQIQNNASAQYVFRFSKHLGKQFEQVGFENTTITDNFAIPKLSTYGTVSLNTDIILPRDRSILAWSFENQVDSNDAYNIYYQYPENNNLHHISQSTLDSTLALSQLPNQARDSALLYSELIDFNSSDPLPAQVHYYRIFGSVIGDYAVAPNVLLKGHNQTYTPEEPFSIELAVANVNHKVDSAIPYTITYHHLASNNTVLRQDGFMDFNSMPLDTIESNVKLSLPGSYRVTIQLNSEESIMEATYFNNTVEFELEMAKDIAPPIIRCTFDSTTISNNQVVSPTTQIAVRLLDENIFRLLDDENLLIVEIYNPDGSMYEIQSGVNAFYHYPKPGSNELILIINGNFTQDGTYSLKARGMDKDGNEVVIPYQINFQVFHKLGFGIQFYPNPVIHTMRINYVLFGPSGISDAELSIFNSVGKSVLSRNLHLNRGQHEIPLSIPKGWPDGLYFYEIIAKDMDGQIIPEYNDVLLGYKANSRRGSFIKLTEK